jgi:hypothetical protein
MAKAIARRKRIVRREWTRADALGIPLGHRRIKNKRA